MLFFIMMLIIIFLADGLVGNTISKFDLIFCLVENIHFFSIFSPILTGYHHVTI